MVERAEGLGSPDAIVFDPADPKWKELLEIDAKMFQRRHLRLLTPEARVLLALLVGGPLQINSAMQVAGTSSRGFYAVLERLKQAGLVNINKDSDDQRVRRLTVDQNEVPQSAG